MSRATKMLYVLVSSILYLSSYFIIQTIIKSSEFDLLTELDKSIPFMPEHVWIYHTLLPVIVITMILVVSSKKVFFNILLAAAISAVILNLSYILFPSFYPRPEVIPHTLSELLVNITHKIDSPSNTFPSSHVTFAWIMFFGSIYTKYAAKTIGIKSLYLLWAIGITLSTLTLKQHYIVDTISGFMLACISFYIAKTITEKYYFLEHS
jgi:membrane-associated phospholipid phosphatase